MTAYVKNKVQTEVEFERSLLDEEIDSMFGIATAEPVDEDVRLLPAQYHSQLEVEQTWSSASISSEIIPTPPPDTQDYTYNSSCTLSDKYMKGSSLEDSPVSSPSSCEEMVMKVEKQDEACDDVSPGGSPSEPRSPHKRSRSESFDDSSDEDEQPVPKNIKLPQRKGGMQLWQFLYTLLTDSKKRYQEMIEWTSNVKSREFRLLEPEAIAIWWGEHKNKKNMSYDKLSRSLRYYYDKGIIRKIPGERYVYQFCVDPEIMYKHIGNSECRPKLKAMPNAAKMSMSKYQTQVMGYSMPPLNDPFFVAQGPVSLSALHNQQHPLPPNYPFPFMIHSPLPPMLPAHPFENVGYIHKMTSCPVNIRGPIEDIKPLPMRRSQSFDSCYSTHEQRPMFDHHDPNPPLSMYTSTNPMDSLYCIPPQIVSPNAMSSGTESPSFSIDDHNELDLDTLIEITSSEDYMTQSLTDVYSPPADSKPRITTSTNHLPTWNY